MATLHVMKMVLGELLRLPLCEHSFFDKTTCFYSSHTLTSCLPVKKSLSSCLKSLPVKKRFSAYQTTYLDYYL